jgi:hypothetical protein
MTAVADITEKREIVDRKNCFFHDPDLCGLGDKLEATKRNLIADDVGFPHSN